MKKFKNLETKKKFLIFSNVVALMVVGGLVGFKQYDKQKRVEAVQELTAKNEEMKQIQKGIDSFVLDKGYLSKNVSSDVLEKNITQLKKLKDFTKNDYVEEKEYKGFIKKVESADKQINQVANKFDAQKELNELFEADVIVESEVSKEGIVKEDVETVELDLSNFKTEDDWLVSIQKEVENVKNQVKVKLEATKSVEAFFSQDKVKEGVTRKQYDASAKQVKSVKNKKVQDKLNKKLSKVNEELKRLDKVAKEKAEKEATSVGGSVEKKEDGSYVVVQPAPQEVVSDNSGAVVSSRSASGTQSYSNNDGGSNYNEPATNSYSDGGTSNNYSSGGSNGGSQSSGSVAPSNAGANNNNYTEHNVQTNPLTGGDVYGGTLDNVDPNNFDVTDMPGVEYYNGNK